MKEITLGARVYFIREEEDQLPERALAAFADGTIFTIPPADVFVQDSNGSFVSVNDEFTIALVKKAAAELPLASKTGRSDWRKTVHRWLNQQIEAGNVKLPSGTGKSWEITQTKDDVFRELDLKIAKIAFSTFVSGLRPKQFKHKGFPLRWANPGGRPKTMGG